MGRIPLRRVLWAVVAAVGCGGLVAVSCVAWADGVRGSSSPGSGSSNGGGDEGASPDVRCYDLDVEFVVERTGPAKEADDQAGATGSDESAKSCHIKMAVWRDLPFEATFETDGQAFLVRGAFAETASGRLRLTITTRQGGSEWHRESTTTVELAPQERMRISTGGLLTESPSHPSFLFKNYATLTPRSARRSGSSNGCGDELAGREGGDDGAFANARCFELDVECVTEEIASGGEADGQSAAARRVESEQNCHIKMTVWRDLPFEFAMEAGGREYLVRGTPGEAPNGRVRLAISFRRAGSGWMRGYATSGIDLVPGKRMRIAGRVEIPPRPPVEECMIFAIRRRAASRSGSAGD